MNADPIIILRTLFDPSTLFLMTLGTVVGIVLGAIPGLTGTLGIALLLPFTYHLDPAGGLIMLGSVYCGAEYGGAIPAVLINTPGTGSAMCTTFDGYPMAQKGMAAEALDTSLIVSIVGGIFGVFALLFLSVPLSKIAMHFGPPEQFWLCIFALTCLAGVSTGNLLKGIAGGLLGLLLSTVGQDAITGYPRFTFGSINLLGGIETVPVIIGLFAIPQTFLLMEKGGGTKVGVFKREKGRFLKVCKEIIKRWRVCIQASIIGVIVGIMPGAGSNVAAFLAYNEAKRFSKNPQEFGTGIYEGVIAPEAANNSCVGGALIPTLTMGIPGSPATAVLLGGMMILGLQPGFKLFNDNPNVVYTFMAGLFLSNITILLLGSIFISIFVRVLNVPAKFVIAAIFCLAFIGSYAIRNATIDVISMLSAGIIGYFLVKTGFGVITIALGLILGGLTEEGFKLSLLIGSAKGSVFLYFFQRPACIVLIVLTIISILYSIYGSYKASKKPNRQ